MVSNNFSQSHIKAYFRLEGAEYEIEDITIHFNQPVDFKGQPQSKVSGGQIHLVLSHLPDDNLYQWAVKSTLCKDGEIAFRREMASNPLTVKFSRAYCCKLSLEVDGFEGCKTVLFISPETVRVNDVEHLNYWK